MNQQEIINRATLFAKDILKNDATGHDFDHVIRVKEKAMYLQRHEGGDIFIISLASLLHDVDDHKLFPNHQHLENATSFLDAEDISETDKNKILEIIQQISFKGKDSQTPSTLEGRIVQDADRLDAIGAIGIARTFAFGGAKGRKLYDFTERPKRDMTEGEYLNNNSSSLTHFYEKLLLLKDLMNTDTAKKMAGRRHRFMQLYLKEFLDELNLNEDD